MMTEITADKLVSRRRTGLVTSFALLAFVATAIRFFGLNQWGLWIDELLTVSHAAQIVQGSSEFRPLGFLMHAIWFTLVGIETSQIPINQFDAWPALGVTPFLMRVPAAFVGAISIPLLAWSMRRLLSPLELFIFSLAVTVSAWHIWMSQVARIYSLQFLLFALALILYYRATESQRFRLFVWALIATLAAYLTQPTSLIVLGIFAVDWLFVTFFEKRRIWRWPEWLGLVLTGVACVAWLFAFILAKPAHFTEFQAGHQSIATMITGAVFLTGVPTVIVAGASSFMLWQRDRRLAVFLTTSWFLPVIAFVALRFLGEPVHVRYVFVALFPCLVLASIGLVRLFELVRPRAGRLFAIAPALGVLGASALQAFLYFQYGDGYRARWQEAADYVRANRQAGDRVAGAQGGTHMAKFYLEEPQVAPLEDVLAQYEAGTLAHTTWVIARVYEPSIGSAAEKPVPGELMRYFSNQVTQPRHVVNVSRIVPEKKP